MEYFSVNARFLFNSGKLRYTVEFTFGLGMWFVFKEYETTNCVYKKKADKKLKWGGVNVGNAEIILYEYLDKT